MAMTTSDIMNTVRSFCSETYKQAIPLATQASIAETGNAILSASIYYNEFVQNLVDKIAFSMIHANDIKNPLRQFNRGMLPTGRTIEELWVDAAKAHEYNTEKGETEVFKREAPDVSAIYHTINRRDFYKQTTNWDILKDAFRSEDGLEKLLSRIVAALYNGDEQDSFMIMKQLIGDYISAGLAFPVHVDPVTDTASAENLVIKIREMVNYCRLPSRLYNSLGVLRRDRDDDQILITNPTVDAQTSVKVLAAAFNRSDAEFLARRIVTDDYGTGADGTVCVLTDTDFIINYDTVYRATEIFNPQLLDWNHFLHHHGIYSTSRFSNVINFTTKPISVNSVSLSPASVPEAKAGTMTQFSATVAGDEAAYVPQSIIWKIEGNKRNESYIDHTGRLFISASEPAGKISVIAASAYNPTVKASAAVTIK